MELGSTTNRDSARGGNGGDALPLSGVRVLDCVTYIAAPAAAAMLAEFGADVIKIEKPGTGDPLRVFGMPSGRPDATLSWLNEARNKRSITLDLRKPKGAALFKRLATDADVVCENFRPGTLERWGLGWDVLAALNPGLVMLRVTGFGQTGPYKDRVGFARMAHAFGGIGYLAGHPGEPPVNPGPSSLADYMAAVYGAMGVLLALRARDASGLGQMVDLGLYEAVFRSLDEALPAFAKHGRVREPSGSRTPAVAPNANFPTGDGQWASLSCTDDRMFGRLAQAMGRPELAADPRYAKNAARLENRDEVEGMTSAWTASLTRAALVAKCEEFEVPCAPILSIADIFADPHYRARENFAVLEDPVAGEVVLPNVAPRLSRTPGRVRWLGPTLGEANGDVYGGELGLTESEIAALAAEGVI